MKYNLDGVLVVEGKSDVSYLSSFIHGLFFITNGYDLSEEKIIFLKEVAKVNKLIILTDPDDAGEVIRNRMEKQINQVFVVKINAKTRKNYKKKGVAEANRDEIVKSLKPYFVEEPIKYNRYYLNTLITFHERGREIKNEMIKDYRLIFGNVKSLENQLNMLKISPLEINDYFEKDSYGN